LFNILSTTLDLGEFEHTFTKETYQKEEQKRTKEFLAGSRKNAREIIIIHQEQSVLHV
jgi:hypothetical protein